MTGERAISTKTKQNELQSKISMIRIGNGLQVIEVPTRFHHAESRRSNLWVFSISNIIVTVLKAMNQVSLFMLARPLISLASSVVFTMLTK